MTCLLTSLSRPSAPLAGKSALHWAAAVNNVEAAVAVLLKNGANKDMNNKVGWLARHFPSATPFPTGGPRAMTWSFWASAPNPLSPRRSCGKNRDVGAGVAGAPCLPLATLPVPSGPGHGQLQLSTPHVTVTCDLTVLAVTGRDGLTQMVH